MSDLSVMTAEIARLRCQNRRMEEALRMAMAWTASDLRRARNDAAPTVTTAALEHRIAVLHEALEAVVPERRGS